MPQPSDLRVLLDPLSKSRPGPAGQAQVLASIFDGSLSCPVCDDVPPPVHQCQDDQAGEQVNESEISNVHEVLPKGADFLAACPPPATPAAADSLAAPAAARQGAGTLEEFEAWLVTRYERLDALSKQLLERMEAQEQPIVPVYDEFERVHRQMGELLDARAVLGQFLRGAAA